MDTLPPHPDQPSTRPVTASTSSSGHSTKGKGSPFSNLPVSDDPDPFAAGASRRASPRQMPPRVPTQNSSSRRNSESTTIKPVKNTKTRHSHQPIESSSTVSSSTSNDFSPNSSKDWDQDTPTTSNPGLNILPAVGSNFASSQEYQPTHTQRQSIARVPPPSVDGRPLSSGSNIRPSSSHQSKQKTSRPSTATATITQVGGGATNGENRYSVSQQNGKANIDRSSSNLTHQRVGALPPLQTNISRTGSPARSSPRSPQDGFPSELLRTNSADISRKDARTPSPNRASLHPGTSLQVPGSSSSRRSSQRVQPPPRPSSDELAASEPSPSSTTPPLSSSVTAASNKSTTSTVPTLTESQAIRQQYMATAQQQLPPNSNFLPQRRPPEPPQVRRGSAQDQQSTYSRDSRPMSAGTGRDSRPMSSSTGRDSRPMSSGTERSRPPKSPDKKPKRTFQPPPPTSSRDKNPKANANANAKPSAPRSPTSNNKAAAPRSVSSQTKRRHASAESFMSPPLNQYGDPIILSRREPEPVSRPTSPFKRPTSPFKRPTSPVQWVQKAFRRNSQPVFETNRMSTAPGNLDTIHERRALTPEPRPLGLIRSRSPPPTAKSMPDMGREEKKNKRLSAAALFATVFGFKGRRRGRRQNAAKNVEISGPVGAPVRPLGEGAGVGPLPVGRIDQIRPVAGGDMSKSLGPALQTSLPPPTQLNAIPEDFLPSDLDDDPIITPRQKATLSMAEFLNDGRPPNPKALVQVPTNSPEAGVGQNGPVQIPSQQGQLRNAPPRPAPPPTAPIVQRESTVEALMSNDSKMKRSGMVFADNVVMPMGRSRSNSGATQTTQATTKTSASSGRPQSNATFGIPNGIPNGPGLPPHFVPPIPPPRASSLHSPESDAESIASGMRSRSGSIKSARSKLEIPPVPSPSLSPDAVSQNPSPISPIFPTPSTDVNKEVVQHAIVQPVVQPVAQFAAQPATVQPADQPAIVQPAIALTKSRDVRPDTMVSVSTDNEEFEDAIDDSAEPNIMIPTINNSSAAVSLHDLPGLRKPDDDSRGLNIATTDGSEYSTAQDTNKKNMSISTLASFDVSAFPRASQLPVPDNLTDEQRERLVKAGVGLPGLEKAPTQNGLLTTSNNRSRDDDNKPPSPKVFPPRDSRQEGEFVFPDRAGEREFLFSNEELSEKQKILESPKSPTPDPVKSKRASWMPSWANENEGPVSPKPLRPTSSVFSMLTRPLSMWSPAAETEDKKDELVEPPASPVSSGRITTPRSSVESQVDRAERFSDTSVASNTVASGESVSSIPEKKEAAPPQTQKLLSRIDELEAKIRELTAAKEGQSPTEEQKVEKEEVEKSVGPSAMAGATLAPSTVFVQGKRMDVGELKREYEFLIHQMDFLHRTIAGPGGVGGQMAPPSPESNASVSARSSASMNGFLPPAEAPSKTLSVRPVSPFGRRPVSPAMSDGRPSSPTGSMSSATSSSYGRRFSQRMSLRRPASPVGINSQLEMDQMKKTVSRIEGLFDALDMLYKERVAEIEADSEDEKEYIKELADRKENPEDEYSDDEFEELTESELEQARQEREQQRKRLQEFGSWLDTTKDNCRNLQSVLGNAMDEGPAGLYMPSAASTNEGNMLSMMSLAAKLGNASPPKRTSASFSPRNSGNFGAGKRNSQLSTTSSTSSNTLSKRGFGFGRPGSRSSMTMPRGDIPARRESLLYGTYRPRGLDAVAEERKVAEENVADPGIATEAREETIKEDTITTIPPTAAIATAEDPQRNAAIESFYLVAVVVMAIAVVRSVEYILPSTVSNIANGLIGGTASILLSIIGKMFGASHLAENVASFGAYLPMEHRAEWVATAVLVMWGWSRVARVAPV